MLRTVDELANGCDSGWKTAGLRWSHERGTTIRALAAETGRSYGSVQRLLTEAGAILRPRGNDGNRASRQPPILSRFSL